jgi:hypothetical protein
MSTHKVSTPHMARRERQAMAERACVNCGGREADGQALAFHDGELLCSGAGDCDRREYGRWYVDGEIAAIEQQAADDTAYVAVRDYESEADREAEA